jgi:hypothetical protein
MSKSHHRHIQGAGGRIIKLPWLWQNATLSAGYSNSMGTLNSDLDQSKTGVSTLFVPMGYRESIG